MSLPVTLPYTIGSLSGLVPASDLDANYNALTEAINGINNGTNPLTGVSVTGGTWAGSPIGVSYGGTGRTSAPTNGQLLIGNGTGYTLSTISAGSGITVTNTSGGISIAVSGGSTGTVTSVAVSGGTTGLTTSGGPITTTGTITLAGTLAVANGGTGVTTSTGSGNNVLSTSPTLVTPILGTPASVTLTNATGLPLTTGVTGTLAATNGGTGLNTYATGDIIYASATNTLSKLVAGTNGFVLKLAGGVPTWQSASAALVVGTSTVTGGASGQILYDNSGVIGEKATTGSGNVVLATSPTLVTPVLGTPTSVTLTNATGLPVGGISATGTPSVTTFLRGDGSWSSPATASGLTVGTTTITGGTAGRILYDNSGVVGELTSVPVANGGTGATTESGARTNLSAAASGANTDITSVTLTTGTISTNPTAITNIANKLYVDNLVAGVTSQISCDYGSTADLGVVTYNNGTSGVGATITKGSPFATFSIDGASPTVGKRILVKNQTTQLQNGVYSVTSVGSGSAGWVLTRVSDYDASSEITAGDAFYVELGTTNSNTQWVQQTQGTITVGTTAISFIQFGGSGGTTGIKQPYAANGAVYASSATALTTGTLPVTGGGTGAATLTANSVLIGNGTSAVTAVAPGTTGNLLTSNGTAWVSTANTGVSTGKAIAMAIVFGG